MNNVKNGLISLIDKKECRKKHKLKLDNTSYTAITHKNS